jgi:hypothetical protein
MVSADARLPRAELTNNPHGALHPILVTDTAARAKPLVEGLANVMPPRTRIRRPP